MRLSRPLQRLFLLLITVYGIGLLSAAAQTEQRTLQIAWDSKTLQQGNPEFEGGEYQGNTPYFTRSFELRAIPDTVHVQPSFEFERPDSTLPSSFINGLAEAYKVQHTISYEDKQPVLMVSIVPAFRDEGTVNFLQTAQVVIDYPISPSLNTLSKQKSGETSWPRSSVLADGDWYRVRIDTTSIFKLTYKDLKDLGVQVDNLSPDALHLYGNGGRMLPQSNDTEHPRSLKPAPVAVYAGNDGKMDQGDYLLFYGEGSHGWAYDQGSEKFQHEYHEYSDSTYYFLTVDRARDPVRIATERSLSEAAYTTSQFDQLLFHERDQLTEINREISSGRRWFGEAFSSQTRSRQFDFTFVSQPQSVDFQYRMAHHGESGGVFTINTNGRTVARVNMRATSPGYTAPFASVSQGTKVLNPNTNQLSLTLTYQGGNSTKGWLDHLSLAGRTDLRYAGRPLLFQNKTAAEHPTVRYQLAGLPSSAQVWDITHNSTVHRQNLNKQDGFRTFTDSGGQVRRYLAFEPSDARPVQPIGKVANQNLHGLPSADMLIVTHPRFREQAQELANFHRQTDGLKSHVVTPQAIYNEFASGKQDITAIRWFAKMFYDRADDPSGQPDYLVLFGDASYDYKDRLEDNTNLVPTYESPNATNPSTSYLSDDYYGYLDANEGALDKANGTDLLDISIGRIPVNTPKQAQQVIDKIKRYYQNKNHFGSWQNTLTFMADDMEESWEKRFVEDSEALIGRLNKQAPAFNMDKIYADAYEQQTTSGGKRYPAVSEAINQQINEGSLIMNYMGHGGERGLGSERIVTFDDIQQWNNEYRMPLLVTATCEFTRFDAPSLLSAGERAFLKPDGGAIALLSTTRLVTAGSNYELTRKVFEQNLFTREAGEHKTIGEVMKDAKNAYTKDNNFFNANTRKFALIGDPALKLAYPKHEVVTTRINRRPFQSKDSLKALQKVTLQGEVRNTQGERLKNFNGEVYPTVYDKEVEQRTLANDPAARPLDFKLLNSIIYDGKAPVDNGRFRATFVVPKDISYELGTGKISYYATDYESDAHGYDRVTVGGTADSPVVDDQPPEVVLYLNTRTFKDGGTTGPNPLVLADIQDDNGINTAANGIGHQPQLTLDGERALSLSDAYQASLDTFNKGTLRHPLTNLSPGRHYLQLKVWDVTNKSASDRLSFLVVGEDQLTVEALMNYPNPFSETTTIAFEHNQKGNPLTIKLNVYNMQGQQVATATQQGQPEASRQTLEWDGTNAHGAPLSPGVYIYEVTLTNQKGATVQESSRLVIQK